MAGTLERERELTSAITSVVESSLPGVEVLAVEVLSPSRFCVYIDRDGGVGFDVCEAVTGLLGAYREKWTIDVSSPGPERPLRRPEHFAAAVGRRVQLRTEREICGRTRFSGVLTDSTSDAVTLDHNETRYEIPVGVIARANLIDEGR